MSQHVLIADSDTAALELVTAILTRNGFEITPTVDGAAALATFVTESPHIVICDTALDMLPGEVLSREIRARNANVQIVLMCDQDLDEEERTALGAKAECSAILPRPFRYGAFQKLLDSWGSSHTPQIDPTPSFSFSIPSIDPLTTIAKPASPENLTVTAAMPARPMTLAVTLPTAPLPVPLPNKADTPVAPVLPEIDLDDIAQPALPEIPLNEVIESQKQPSPKVPIESHLPSSVARFGDLTTTPLPRLMFELYIGAYSGIVHLSRKSLKRSAYFYNGFPVRMDSEELEHALGHILLKQGRITQDQYTKAQQKMLGGNVRMGEALVQMGVFRESELLDALRDQTQSKWVDTIGWREGTYSIEDNTDFVATSVINEFHPLQLIWAGVHEHYELTGLFNFFANLRNHYIEGTNLFAVHFETLEPLIQDIDLASILNGNTTFEDALRSDDSRAVDIAQALYVLLVTEMIRPSKKTCNAVAIPTTSPQKSTEIANYAELTATFDTIAKAYMLLKENDPYGMLGIAGDATNAEIEAAFEAMSNLVDHTTLPHGLPAYVIKRAKEVSKGLNQARKQLLDPALRPKAKKPKTLDPALNRRKSLMDAENLYREGLQLMRKHDYTCAQQKFEEAINLNATEPTYRVGIAQALVGSAQPQNVVALGNAFQHLEFALQLSPNNIPANLEMAGLLIKAKQPLKAKPLLERVLQRAPEHLGAQQLLQEIENNAGQQ